MGTQQRVGPRNLLAASGSQPAQLGALQGGAGLQPSVPCSSLPLPSCLSLAGRYLQPTFPLGAARPPPHSPSVRPQDPGSSCGSPSSCPRCSCRTPVDYTSRRPPRHCHVTCLAPILLAEGSLELRLPASRAAASEADRCAVRISGGRSGRGVRSLLRAGTARPRAPRARLGVSASRFPDHGCPPRPRCGLAPRGGGRAGPTR